MFLNSVWVVKFGALGAGERGVEKSKPAMDSKPAMPTYILFLSSFPALLNAYPFTGNTDVTGRASDLIDVRIRYTYRGLVKRVH